MESGSGPGALPGAPRGTPLDSAPENFGVLKAVKNARLIFRERGVKYFSFQRIFKIVLHLENTILNYPCCKVIFDTRLFGPYHILRPNKCGASSRLCSYS